MRKLILSLLGSLALPMALAVPPVAHATTTVINFDDIASGTDVTTQYENVGVLASGVTALDQLGNSFSAYTPPNVGVAYGGLMTFTLNQAITGNVRTVSAYVLGAAGVGIYAYDAGNVLVGQAILPAGSGQTWPPLSVTSSGNPITKVLIHDGGGAFVVDNLSFISDVPFAKYAASVYLAPKVAYFSALESFTLGAGSTGLNLSTQPVSLTFGSLTLNIPAGAFVKDTPPRKNSYVYQGALNGGTLYVSITPTKTANTYQLFALGAGYVFPTSLSTMPVALAIGDNDGQTNVTPNYVPHVPTSP
ncbi:hypothetical protein [Burkholderia sp.]|uniref:hypothetical protein n=1 Tax=Burkholderia sp. TaxID=36773 RepID=UPI0025BFCF88|nr:hypothetical protein [Burkholderia sp.]MBS6362588.1 hypothetical protein [Burkholderia sp.]